MPAWAVAVIATAGVLAAVTAIAKAIRAGARLIARGEELVPVWQEQASLYRANPNVWKQIGDIAAQFRTDSGTSLRDVVNRLEAALDELRLAVASLTLGAETDRALDVAAREQVSRLLREVDRLTDRVHESLVTLNAVQTAAGVDREMVKTVADNLVLAQAAVDLLADDAAGAHARADAIIGQPGEAADEAARSGPSDQTTNQVDL